MRHRQGQWEERPVLLSRANFSACSAIRSALCSRLEALSLGFVGSSSAGLSLGRKRRILQVDGLVIVPKVSGIEIVRHALAVVAKPAVETPVSTARRCRQTTEAPFAKATRDITCCFECLRHRHRVIGDRIPALGFRFAHLRQALALSAWRLSRMKVHAPDACVIKTQRDVEQHRVPAVMIQSFMPSAAMRRGSARICFWP